MRLSVGVPPAPRKAQREAGSRRAESRHPLRLAAVSADLKVRLYECRLDGPAAAYARSELRRATEAGPHIGGNGSVPQ